MLVCKVCWVCYYLVSFCLLEVNRSCSISLRQHDLRFGCKTFFCVRSKPSARITRYRCITGILKDWSVGLWFSWSLRNTPPVILSTQERISRKILSRHKANRSRNFSTLFLSCNIFHSPSFLLSSLSSPTALRVASPRNPLRKPAYPITKSR